MSTGMHHNCALKIEGLEGRWLSNATAPVVPPPPLLYVVPLVASSQPPLAHDARAAIPEGTDPYDSLIRVLAPSFPRGDRALPSTSTHLAEPTGPEGGAYDRPARDQAAGSTETGAALPRDADYQEDADHGQAVQIDQDEDDYRDLPPPLVVATELEGGRNPATFDPTTAQTNVAMNASNLHAFAVVAVDVLGQRFPFPAPVGNAPAAPTNPPDIDAPGPPPEVCLPDRATPLTNEPELPNAPWFRAEEFVPLVTGALSAALPGDIAALGDGLGRFLDNVVATASGPGGVPDGPDDRFWLVRATLIAGMFVGFSLVLRRRSAPRPSLDPGELAATRCWFPTIKTPTEWTGR